MMDLDHLAASCFFFGKSRILSNLAASRNLQAHRISAQSINPRCPARKLRFRIIIKSVDGNQRMSCHAISSSVSGAWYASRYHIGIITNGLCQHCKTAGKVIAVARPLFKNFQGVIILPSIIYLKVSPGPIPKASPVCHILKSRTELLRLGHPGSYDRL